jgi:hypothetical protein
MARTEKRFDFGFLSFLLFPQIRRRCAMVGSVYASYQIREVFLLGYLLVFGLPDVQVQNTGPVVPKDTARAQAAQRPEPAGAEERLDQEIQNYRQGYRDGLAGAARFAMVGAILFIILIIIVAYVMLYSPDKIPQAKPFDPEVDRKKPKGQA